MSRPWEADVDVTDDLARSLIESQFPELAPARLDRIGVGWDNIAFRVNGDWVFRVPTRKLGARIMEKEIRWMPVLAPHVSVPHSCPRKVGKPGGDYPYFFAGYPMIEGTTGCRARPSGRCAEQVAEVLKTIHAVPPPDDGPVDDLNRTDLSARVKFLRERFGGDWGPGVEEAVVGLSRTPPWPKPNVWLHGDLYARHLILDGRGDLAGIIDWGDLHVGDPAMDLSVAWTSFDAPDRARFFEVYGAVDSDTRARARFRALHYGIILADYGKSVGDDPLRRVGEKSIRHVLDPD